MESLFLVARIAGERVAIPSNEVESVVKVDNIVNVPGASPLIAGLFALRSRVLTIIDTQYHITEQKRLPVDHDYCVITEIEGHPYGLIVDAVEDVMTVKSDDLLNIGFANEKWRLISSGMMSHDDKLLLLLNTKALVAVKEGVAA